MYMEQKLQSCEEVSLDSFMSMALVVCKHSIAVVFILEVNWSKIKYRKSELLGPVSFVLLTHLGKGNLCSAQLQALAIWNAKFLM